jgi:hypothetical protein
MKVSFMRPMPFKKKLNNNLIMCEHAAGGVHGISISYRNSMHSKRLSLLSPHATEWVFEHLHLTRNWREIGWWQRATSQLLSGDAVEDSTRDR